MDDSWYKKHCRSCEGVIYLNEVYDQEDLICDSCKEINNVEDEIRKFRQGFKYKKQSEEL